MAVTALIALILNTEIQTATAEAIVIGTAAIITRPKDKDVKAIKNGD